MCICVILQTKVDLLSRMNLIDVIFDCMSWAWSKKMWTSCDSEPECCRRGAFFTVNWGGTYPVVCDDQLRLLPCNEHWNSQELLEEIETKLALRDAVTNVRCRIRDWVSSCSANSTVNKKGPWRGKVDTVLSYSCAVLTMCATQSY